MPFVSFLFRLLFISQSLDVLNQTTPVWNLLDILILLSPEPITGLLVVEHSIQYFLCHPAISLVLVKVYLWIWVSQCTARSSAAALVWYLAQTNLP